MEIQVTLFLRGETFKKGKVVVIRVEFITKGEAKFGYSDEQGGVLPAGGELPEGS